MVSCLHINVNGGGLPRPQEPGLDAVRPTLSVEVKVPPRAELHGNTVGEGGPNPCREVNGPQFFSPLRPLSQGLCADLPLCPHCLLSQLHKPSVVLRLSRVHKCLVKIAGEQEHFMLVATLAQTIKPVPTQGWGLLWFCSQALCTPN